MNVSQCNVLTRIAVQLKLCVGVCVYVCMFSFSLPHYIVTGGNYIHNLQPPYISFLVYYTQAFLQFPGPGIQSF